MAKPDIDDGWFKISVELEAALAYAGFSTVARVLLSYVFVQIYGRGKRPDLASLPQKRIADRMNQKPSAINRAIRELVTSGALKEAGDDRYRFIKDYERWLTWSRDKVNQGKLRLTPAEVEDCKRMPAYAESVRIKGYVDCADLKVNQMVKPSEPSGSVQLTNGLSAPIEDRARGLRELEREEESFLREGKKNELDSAPEKSGGIDWHAAALRTNENGGVP